jgi:hypothetical protein
MNLLVRVLDAQPSRQIIFGFLASEDSVLFMRAIRDQTSDASTAASATTDSFEEYGPLELNSEVARQCFGMVFVLQ